ncbi:N-terminal phage integrase SAM-like domain-containing protein, partial [Lysinibacillus sp. M3]
MKHQDIYNMWVEQYENSVEESTFVKTIGIFKNHILPAMGAYKVDKIDIATCQKHIYQWAKKLKRFRMVKSYAAKVLDYAIKHSCIDKNPFALVEIPSTYYYTWFTTYTTNAKIYMYKRTHLKMYTFGSLSRIL